MGQITIYLVFIQQNILTYYPILNFMQVIDLSRANMIRPYNPKNNFIIINKLSF